MSDIESETLETYFHDKLDRSYKVPRFQRGYSWKSGNVDDFLNDIENLDDGSHYFGMFFFREIPGHRREIIDGQQRITSVVLYLIACRDYLQEKLDQATTEKVEIKKFVKELEDMLISFNGRKILELGKTNEELFENMYDYKEYDAKIKQANSHILSDDDRHLLDAYKKIYDKIKNEDLATIKSNKKKTL